jgi:hypothetical protein
LGECGAWIPSDKFDVELSLLLLGIVGHATKWCDVESEWSTFVGASWPTLLNDELEFALGVDEPVTVLSPSVRWDLSSASRRAK